MKIETIEVRKALKEIKMTRIPSFCVVVGANGTGKTTLFDLFGFLKDCLTHNVSKGFRICH